MDGNVGDHMIHVATEQMFASFGIAYRRLDRQEVQDGNLRQPVDEIVISGGGNMGKFYPINYELRRAALALNKPVTILPQSFVTDDEDTHSYKTVYVRERVSQSLDRRYLLAPDTALGLNIEGYSLKASTKEFGVFLRKDRESCQYYSSLSRGDPVLLCETVAKYLQLAADYRTIITDRLHFAIAGLLVGNSVILLPNSYFKNRAVHQTWLADLGCLWSDDIDRALGLVTRE